jgi:hypothetical protein
MEYSIFTEIPNHFKSNFIPWFSSVRLWKLCRYDLPQISITAKTVEALGLFCWMENIEVDNDLLSLKKRFLDHPIISSCWMEIVASHAHALDNPGGYRSVILTQKSPLFPVLPFKFVSDLLARSPEASELFEEFLRLSVSSGCSMPNLITVTSVHLRLQKKRRDQILSILTQLLKLAQTFAAAQEFTECLEANSTH